MCSFEWIGLHFKTIFRGLAGFERPENSPVDCFQWYERPENSPVDCFQRGRVGRPPLDGSADPRRTGRQAPELSQGKSTPKCRQRRRNCASGILETHSKALRLIPTRSHQTVSKRFCLGGLARGIYMIRIILRLLAIVIFVVIVLSR